MPQFNTSNEEISLPFLVPGEDSSFLDKNHTNFILVKNENDNFIKFGSELPFRSQLEKNLSDDCNKFFFAFN